MPLLSVKNLSLTIESQRILREVNLDVEAGEVVGVIGPNGSGKTTFFNVISGFLKPTSGSVYFRDENISTMRPSLRSRLGIGRVFQNFGIFRDMTLEDNVIVAFESLPKEQRMTLGDLSKKVRETLKLIGLDHCAKKKANSLSGGQMRLLELARTFFSRKELLLLDEPTAGVSPKMTGQISDLIRMLRKEGRTILIIEHDLPFIRRICDRVIVLDLGEIVLEGKPEEIHSHAKLKEIYFGADPVT